MMPPQHGQIQSVAPALSVWKCEPSPLEIMAGREGAPSSESCHAIGVQCSSHGPLSTTRHRFERPRLTLVGTKVDENAHLPSMHFALWALVDSRTSPRFPY